MTTFQQIKTGVSGIILGTFIATTGYMLWTASYVGSSTDMMLTPRNTDKGTQWNAEDAQIAVEVRYITSLIEKPTITIKRKQQWLPLAISLGSGMLVAFIYFKVASKKSPQDPGPVKPSIPENTESVL